jgi:hypothetical protein
MLSNVERQRAFRKRMVEKGYICKNIWVLRDDLKRNVKLTKEIFLRKLDELTVSFSAAKLTKVYTEIITLIKSRKEEYETKEH